MVSAFRGEREPVFSSDAIGKCATVCFVDLAVLPSLLFLIYTHDRRSRTRSSNHTPTWHKLSERVTFTSALSLASIFRSEIPLESFTILQNKTIDHP